MVDLSNSVPDSSTQTGVFTAVSSNINAHGASVERLTLHTCSPSCSMASWRAVSDEASLGIVVPLHIM